MHLQKIKLLIILLFISKQICAIESLQHDPFNIDLLDVKKERIDLNEYTITSTNYINKKQIDDLKKIIPESKEIYFDTTTHQLVYPKEIDDSVIKTIKNLDKTPKQITLEIKLIEINYESFRQYQSLFSKLSEGIEISYSNATKAFTGPSSFESRLINLEQNGEAKLLAKPSIKTSSQMTAKLNIGEEYPYTSITYYENSAITTVKYIKSGIDLELTPIIRNDNKIEMAFSADVTNVKLTKEVDSNQLPILSRRKINTNILMEDKSTIAIAGMFESKINTNKSGFHPFSKIPLLKNLFRSKQHKEEQSDLVILITPIILNTD